MADPQTIKIVIQNIIQTLMDGVMKRVLIEDPFIKEKHWADKPLYAALVPDEIFKGSHFERRFVTPFGGVWEKLAVEAAKVSMGHAQLGYRIDGTVYSGRLERINEVLRLTLLNDNPQNILENNHSSQFLHLSALVEQNGIELLKKF